MPDYLPALSQLRRSQRFHQERLDRHESREDAAHRAYANLMSIADEAGRQSVPNTIRSIDRALLWAKRERPLSGMRRRFKQTAVEEFKALTFMMNEGPYKAVKRSQVGRESETKVSWVLPQVARDAFSRAARQRAGYHLVSSLAAAEPNPLVLRDIVRQKAAGLSPEFEGAMFDRRTYVVESTELTDAVIAYHEVWPWIGDVSIPQANQLEAEAVQANAAVVRRELEIDIFVNQNGIALTRLFAVPIGTPMSDWNDWQKDAVDASYTQVSDSGLDISDLTPESIKDNILAIHSDLLVALSEHAIDSELRTLAAERVAPHKFDFPLNLGHI